MADVRSLSLSMEYLFLSIAYLSVFCCLIRTDFNFPFAFLSYYLWITRQNDKNICDIIMAINLILILVDILWLITVGGEWTSAMPQNKIWTSLYGLHIFGIIISIMNVIMKLAVVVVAMMIKQNTSGDTRSLNDKNQNSNDYKLQTPLY